jgi:hypothetical protein
MSGKQKQGAPKMIATTTPALDRLQTVETMIYDILGNGGVIRRPLIDESQALRRQTGQMYDAACRKFRTWTPNDEGN